MQTEIIQGYRLSPQQRRVWQLQQTVDAQPYRVRLGVMLEGDLDSCALRAALKQVVRRNEILRTTFHSLHGMTIPVQVIAEDARIAESVHDLTALGAEEQTRRVEALGDEARRRSFDLSGGPLLHADYVELSATRHALILTLPALCADGATMRKLLDEISRAYDARAGFEETEEVLQYADLAEWQNEILAADYAAAGKEFWRGQDWSSLRGPKLALENVPHERASFDPRTLRAPLPDELASLIETVAARCGATPSSFLLACWHALLRRLTGRADVLVGVAFEGRNFAESASALGPLTKYLPVPCGARGDARFDEVLRRVVEFSRDAERWQQPFEWEHAAASIEDGAPPFFHYCFEYARRPAPRTARGVTFSVFDEHACLDRFKVKLCCREEEGAWLFELGFDAALFTHEYARQLAEQYLTLVADAASSPRALVDELEVLGVAERRRVWSQSDETRAAFPSEKCVHELFEAQARRRPAALAVVAADEALSYAELDARAERLARRLRARGVGPEVRVGLYAQRSAGLIVGLLAVLKAGGAYVPLDEGWPRARLAQQLQEAAARVLLTQRSLLGQAPDFAGHVLCFDEEDEGRAALSDADGGLAREARPEHLAYLIYTSGSTGVPKAVGVTHRNLVNYASYLCRRLGLGELPETEALSFATVTTQSADLGNTSIFGALLSGGCLHVVGYEVATDAAKMAAYMTAHGVDVLKIVPSHMSALLMSERGAAVLPRRHLILGGEALGPELVRRVNELGGCRVLNHYGPTETTVGVLTHAVGETGEAWRTRSTVPIGRPIANSEAYVLDARMRPVPTGVAGELYLGGAGLARGYVNSAPQTAERFVPHPFARAGGERLYRTGDLARFLADGAIEFVGRADEQLKVRGYRVEPGEIEAVLKQHEGVREAFVLAREDEPGRKSLVGYVVPARARAATIEGRRRYVLPNGMAVVQQNEYETDFFYQQIFVDQTNLRHGVSLPPGACVFDVGANIGLFTLFVTRVCPTATVYAFEPIPRTFDSLRLNTQLYGGNVKLYDCGLSDRERQATFTYYPQSSCMSSYYADADRDRETLSRILKQQRKGEPGLNALAPYLEQLADERVQSEQVVCRLKTVSEIIREHEIARIDLLKIDVERSELDVLAGIADDDWPKVRSIVIEAHDVDGQLARLRALLGGRGYRVIVEQDPALEQTGLFNVYATRERDTANGSGRFDPALLATRAASILSTDELQEHLRSRLPSHMLPSALVLLDALPLNANGKVDRKALPAPADARPQKTDYAAPRNEVEHILADIWGRVLGVAPVGIRHDYFALGGDSIRVIQIVHEAGRHGLPLTVMDVIRSRTIDRLAQRLGETRDTNRVSARPAPLELLRLTGRQRALLPADVESAYPASKMQEFVIFHYAHDRQGAGVYHIQQSYHLHDEELSAAALKRALEMTVQAHPALRTTFLFDEEGAVIQLVRKQLAPAFTEVDIRGLSAAEQDERIEAFILRDRAAPFDLDTPDEPLLRCAVFLRSEHSVELFVSMHHAIMDGWGHQELVKEVLGLYHALKDGAPQRPAPPSNTYAEFVALEREALTSADAADFWKSHLRGADAQTLRRRAPEDARPHEANHVHALRSDLAERLRRASGELGVSLKAVLLSAYFDLLGSLTGEESVTAGVVTNGRSERLSNPLTALGLFWNILPLRCVLSDDKAAQVRGVQNTLIEAEQYAAYPLAQILADRRRDELFRATFNYLHFHNMRDHPPRRGLKVLGFRSHDKFHFPLNYVVSVNPFDAGVSLRVEYDRAYFDAGSVRAMTRDYVDLLASAGTIAAQRYE